jgi:hypothetical protein
MANTVRAKARATSKATKHRGHKASPCAIPAVDDREILALRAEFQQLMATRGPLNKRVKPLQAAFYAVGKLNGFEGADAWGHESEFWAVNDEIAVLDERVAELVERMILLRPKTPAGIAAVAASIREDQRHFWKEPEIDRNWDVSLVTRFIDGLIERVSEEARS